MRYDLLKSSSVMLLALLASCASQPIGPTVQVTPAHNKPFDVFAQEEQSCKAYAQGQIAGAVDQVNNNAATGAFLTTALGAGTGALLGGGYGAQAGTAGGAVAGGAVAADTASAGQASIQQRYDTAYSQCMYAKGNQVPGMESPSAQVAPDSQPAAYEAPPPPPPSPRFDPALIASIQGELARIGLLSGAPDGAYGPRTRDAIADYQKTRGFYPDGIPSAALLESLQKS